MKLFCNHDWKEIARTYQKSIVETARENGISSIYQLGDIFSSSTTILWECKKCQATKQEKMLGKLIKQ